MSYEETHREWAAAGRFTFPIYDKPMKSFTAYRAGTILPDAVWSGARGIALRTGEGVAVVDHDTDAPGYDDKGIQWPETFKVRTKSGGYHLYYRLIGGETRNSQSKVGEKVDVRGTNGFVFIPPTRGYEIVDARPMTVVFADMFEGLAEQLNPDTGNRFAWPEEKVSSRRAPWMMSALGYIGATQSFMGWEDFLAAANSLNETWLAEPLAPHKVYELAAHRWRSGL